MAGAVAVLVHGILRALVDVDAAKARAVAADDDEIDRLYHATFDEVVELMRADPGNVERGTRILFASHYLERIGDRVDEHRRGRRLPRDRRDRGPEPVTGQGAPASSRGRPSGSCSCASGTRPGASWPRRSSASAGGDRLRGEQRGHRAQGRQPADPPGPRRGRASITSWARSEVGRPSSSGRRSTTSITVCDQARESLSGLPRRQQSVASLGLRGPGGGRGHLRRSVSPCSGGCVT